MSTDLISHEAQYIRYQLAPLPAPTPRAAASLTSHDYTRHVALLNVAIEATLEQFFARPTDEVVKRCEMEDWTITLEDWPIDQVRSALRQWVWHNSRRRPNYGDILGLLKKRRGDD